MGKTTLKMHKDANGTVWLGKDGKKVDSVTIDKDKDLEIKTSSDFSNAAEVSAFTLYGTDGNHGKGSAIGTWTTTNQTSPSAHLDITISNKGIVIADNNTGAADDDFFFSATVTDGNNSYSSDPELIVKKKTT
jgi:hypothetical protein